MGALDYAMVLISPAAWWSALAQAFHFIFLLIPSLDVLGADVPFVKSQSLCHAFFNKYKVPLMVLSLLILIISGLLIVLILLLLVLNVL
jgi:hypothetical protein